MQVAEAIKIFEDSLRHFQLTAAQTRCENEGEYILGTDNAELYVDIWQPEEASQWQYFDRNEVAGIFQIVAPICYYPSEEYLAHFFEELAHINFHLFYGKFIANSEQKVISIQYKRILKGLNEVEIVEPVEAITYYTENLKEYLHEKYKTEKL
jgi:hypothetical protein